MAKIASPGTHAPEPLDLKFTDRAVQDKLFGIMTNGVEGYAIIMTDPAGLIVSWNKGAENIFGYTESEILGKSIGCFYLPEAVEKRDHEKNLQKASVAPGYSVDDWHIKKDGTKFWASLSYTALFDYDRQLLGFTATVADLTEKRRKPKENNFGDIRQDSKNVTAQQSLYVSIINSSDDAIISKTLQGTITSWNPAAEAIFGYTEKEAVGNHISMIIPEYLLKEETDIIGRISRGEYVQHYETKRVKKDGSYVYVSLSVSPVIAPNGDIIGASKIARNITPQEIEQAQKSLLAEISLIFSQQAVLKDALNKVLERLVTYGNFSGAEFWIIGADKKKINLTANFSKTKILQDFSNKTEIKSYLKGEGLVGTAWETLETQCWRHTDENVKHKRVGAATKAGLKSAYAIPLLYNEEIIGALALGVAAGEIPNPSFITMFENLSSQVGAEIKRKQLADELNQIFNFAPDIICIAGIDRYFKKVNPAMSTILGYTEEELLTQPLTVFIHPDDLESSFAAIKNRDENKHLTYFENRYIAKSGKIKWLAWTSTQSSDEELFFSVAKDITDKKELEELLTKATALARIGAWETELATGITHCSDITRDIYEVGPGFEFTTENLTNFYKKGGNRDTIIKIMDEAVQNGTPADVELQVFTAKENTKWVRVIVETEFAGGKCRRMYGSFQDIDARKKAEIAGIQALEERNTILESIDDAFFAVDRNWTVTYWNNMAEKVLKTPKNEVLGHNLWQVFSESVDSESYRKYHQAMNTNQAVHFEDYFPPLAKWYEISAYPSDTGLSVYFKDVTDRKLSEIRLRELNENLQKHTKELAISNADLEQFAYVASHDLQEPLRMVTSFLTQLEKKYGNVVDDKGKQYIHFAVDGAKRMRQIILDLLEFSRVGRTDDNLEEVDLNKLINEILSLYRKKIEEKHARIFFSSLPTVQTFKTPIRQVLQNLISNSLKYQERGVRPVISILCEEQKNQWQISVKDNGIGIDAAYFNKIFIIFQRLHNKDEYSGTGMGLAIAKKIVESVGGKIWVESEEGKGSTFYFTILKNNKV